MRRLLALCVAIVLTIGLGWSPTALAQAPKDKAATTEAKPAEAKKELIDINMASAEELQTLKGIGDVYAKKIIENRPLQGQGRARLQERDPAGDLQQDQKPDHRQAAGREEVTAMASKLLEFLKKTKEQIFA